MALFAHVIREPADGQQVRRAIQRDAVVEAQPLARQNFVGDGLQPWIGDCQFGHFESAENSNAPNRYRRAPEQQEQQTNITVHREKRSIQPAQVVR